MAAHGPPVEDDEVAGRHVGGVDTGPDRLHHAGRLVAEQEGEVVVDAALAVVQIGVADPARLHLHHGLARTWVRNVDRDDLDRLRHLAGHDCTNLLHGHVSDRSPARAPASPATMGCGGAAPEKEWPSRRTVTRCDGLPRWGYRWSGQASVGRARTR